jgi:glucokinase
VSDAGELPVLALDIGGTKIAAGLIDNTGRLVAAERVPTAPTADGEGLWSTVVGLLDYVRGDTDVCGIGVGCGGPMQWPAGVVTPLNIPGWHDFPLRARLSDYLPGVPVRVHNDAVCLAAGEHWRGAARGSAHALGMVVSTGVGGGLVLDGRLINGRSGNAGHIGHVVVDPDGPTCACGGRGCLEAIARGPAIAEWARKRGWRGGAPGHTAQDVAEDAARGDEVAVAAFARAGEAVGVAIASIAHLCDLEVAVVGGGVTQAGPLLFDPLETALRRHVGLDFARDVRVVPSGLGQHGGLVGAAALIFAADRYWAVD